MDGYGGDFSFEVTVETPSPENWTRAPLEQLKKTLDHKCLFLDLDWFKSYSNSVENLTLYAAEKFLAMPPASGHWRRLRVRESRDLAAVYDFQTRALALEVGLTFPMQWKTEAGWGGGQWRADIQVKRPLDAQTGLIVGRAALERELMLALRPQMGALHTTSDRAVLAQKVAQGLFAVPGFARVELWTDPQRSESFIFSEFDF